MPVEHRTIELAISLEDLPVGVWLKHGDRLGGKRRHGGKGGDSQLSAWALAVKHIASEEKVAGAVNVDEWVRVNRKSFVCGEVYTFVNEGAERGI